MIIEAILHNGSRATTKKNQGGGAGPGSSGDRGCSGSVVLSEPESRTPVPAHQADILGRMGLVIAPLPVPADLVVDALIGYSLRGDPTGQAATLIEWANQQPAPILALDTPSGLDVTTGVAGTPHIQATATLTLALPKIGLIDSSAVGELFLADISVPAIVYQRMGLTTPELFRDDVVIRLG